MTKIDDEDNGISRCGCLCNVVRPDLAAKGVALLRLRMHPLGSHIIIGLPGSLPDKTSIPGTALPSLSLLPILLDLDVRDGRQDRRSISPGPLHVVGVSHIPSNGQSHQRMESACRRNRSTIFRRRREISSAAVRTSTLCRSTQLPDNVMLERTQEKEQHTMERYYQL